MNSNPLPPMLQAYETARDSFKIAKRAIKTVNSPARQRLLQRTCVDRATLTDAECMIEESQSESDALFVLALWATFERFIRDDLQKRGQILCNSKPPVLGISIYQHFEKEVEFWKPGEILDFLKDSLFKKKANLIGHAKQILAYRDWVAHGKNPNKPPSAIPNITDAYNTLDEIVETLLANPPF
jgi:hypothetical protein